MRVFLFLTLLPLFLRAGEPLTYTIQPVELGNKPRLQVTVSFDGAASGISYLRFASNQFGEPNQMEYIRLSQQKPGVTATKEPDSNRIAVRHAPGARVKVVYEILDLQEANRKPFYKYCCNMPIIHPNYFHVQVGHLLLPPGHYWPDDKAVMPVQLHWEGFPADWMLHNSFGPDKHQLVRLQKGQFESAVFVGGDFRRHKFDVNGSPVYFLTRGHWNNFSDDTLVQLLHKIVEGHRAFWNDYSDSIYTITFLPVEGAPFNETEHFSCTGGSGLTNSFMSYATDNAGAPYQSIRYVYVHELMHRWIGGKIENAKEERQYWFSEGFTEYFTLKNSLKYGLITGKEFLQELNNNFVLPHYSSPVGIMPNDSLNYEKFWNGGQEWEKLPYQRGCLYAFYLDNQIREKTHGRKNLDDFMRHLLKAIEAKPGQKLDHAFFLKNLKPYLGKKAVADFKRYIENGERIDFQKVKLPLGLVANVEDVTMQFGSDPEHIDSTKTFKNIPVFRRDTAVEGTVTTENILK